MAGLHVPDQSHAPRKQPVQLSEYSSATIDNGIIFSNDFMLGAGMVLIQPSSGKVVLVCDTADGCWFLPRGRKDVGESLEQAALREAYEESGYRVSFLPIRMPTNAPGPSTVSWIHQRMYGLPSTEPIYITSTYWSRRRPAQVIETSGGLYLTLWYVGQILEDAVAERDTGMPNEKSYRSYLLDIDEALQKLDEWADDREYRIMQMAYKLWQQTVEWESKNGASQATE